MLQHRLVQRRVVQPSQPVVPVKRVSSPTGWRSIARVLVIFVLVLVLAQVFHEYGWVRVVGQIGKHVISPLYRVITFSEYRKRNMIRAVPLAPERVGVFVISLKRAKDRREHMQKQLAGSNYTLIDAIDGNTYDFLLDEDVRKYMGQERMDQAGLQARECTALGKACPMNYRVARQQMSLDLTYIKLFRRIVSDPTIDAAIILEDDARLTVPATDLKDGVLEKVRRLPRDWHLLLLFTFVDLSQFGSEVSPGLHTLLSGVGTAAFVIKKETAQYVLDVGPWLFPALLIDLLMCGFLVETSLINAYVTQPLFMGHGGFVSTKDESVILKRLR
jgi:GR25 family glycosyltransferase involved in LPS biosynthesis